MHEREGYIGLLHCISLDDVGVAGSSYQEGVCDITISFKTVGMVASSPWRAWRHYIWGSGGLGSLDLGGVMICVWIAYGLPMGCQCMSYRLSMDFLWAVYGFPMG